MRTDRRDGSWKPVSIPSDNHLARLVEVAKSTKSLAEDCVIPRVYLPNPCKAKVSLSNEGKLDIPFWCNRVLEIAHIHILYVHVCMYIYIHICIQAYISIYKYTRDIIDICIHAYIYVLMHRYGMYGRLRLSAPSHPVAEAV